MRKLFTILMSLILLTLVQCKPIPEDENDPDAPIGFDTLRQQIDLTMKVGTAQIKPHRDHMSSFVSLVILADTIDEEAKKLIRKTRFQKYFRLALHGWMEYHIAAMETSTNSFLSNPAGKGAKKTLEQNLGSRGK